MLLTTFRKVLSKLKKVSYFRWQNKYTNLKTNVMSNQNCSCKLNFSKRYSNTGLFLWIIWELQEAVAQRCSVNKIFLEIS